MNAVIVQQVRVLDPRTLLDYLKELGRYVQATDPIVHDPIVYNTTLTLDSIPSQPYYKGTWKAEVDPKPFLIPEGPNPAGALPVYSDLITKEEYNRVASATSLGQALYPRVFDILESLNILRAARLKNLATNQTIAGSYDWAHFRNNLEAMCNVPVLFYAKIYPPVAVGTKGAYIGIDLWANVAIYRDMDGSSWNFESPNPRAVKISAGFTDSQQAEIGLRKLPSIFPDATFAEKLLLRGLPKNIARMYRKIAAHERAFWQAYVDYFSGLSDHKPYFDERAHREMTSQAAIRHLTFLGPMVEKLGIHPESVKFYDDKSNLHYDIAVDSLGEVAELISRGYYNGSRIPIIHAVFNGRKVIIEFPSWEHGARIPVAMQITNGSKKGTLESILAGMNNIAGK